MPDASFQFLLRSLVVLAGWVLVFVFGWLVWETLENRRRVERLPPQWLVDQVGEIRAEQRLIKAEATRIGVIVDRMEKQ